MTEKNKIVYDGRTFQGNEVKDGTIYLAASLLFSKLEANTFVATVKSDDPTLTDFQRNAPLTYYYNGEQRGIFYVQDISRVGPNLYRISATSAIGLLIDGQHYGGIYTGQTVGQVLPSICGTVPYIIKSSLADIKLYGWLPVAAPRDNLSQVLFAIGATVKTDMDGVLRIEGLWDGLSGALPRSRLYQGAAVDYTAKVTQVAVTEHQYVEGGDEKQLFAGTAQAGDIITFSEPMYALTATGFTILESGANYAKVSAGSGTLTGRAYIHNTRQITRSVVPAAEPNIKTVEDATLVSLVNSTAIAERLANYFKCVQTINAKVTYDGEIPGDLLAEWHPYDEETVSVCLQSAEITMSNTLAAQEKALVGFEPLQDSEVSYINKVEILTGSGAWVPPEGVSSVRAVLIEEGPGGYSGTRGNNGVLGTTQNRQSGSNYASKRYPGTGGEGGEPGEGNIGGKIFDVTFSVAPGEGISYSCGPGGPGGTPDGKNHVAGRSSVPTLFGEYSSVNGTTYPGGFLEIISGKVYAAPGIAGVAGGNGSGAQKVASGNGFSPFWDVYNTVPGTDVVYKDVTYTPGSKGPSASDNTTYQTFGGYGGGPAAGRNGNDGSSYNGGDGATPVTPDAKTEIGAGGDGGNGGGGGGTNAECFRQQASSYPGPPSCSVGSGAEGSPGGQGGPGGIILYYSVPQKVPTGALMDRNHKIILDKCGRLIVA